jgi:hypothetical protein
MEQGPRKATDVLLEVESKVSMLLDIIRAQDLNIKVLSNKLNDVIGRLDKQQVAPPKIIVETVQTPVQPPMMPPTFTQIPPGDPDRTIPVTAESKLPQAETTQGFRRSSRPETYAGDNSYLPMPAEEMRMPVQLPKMPPGRQMPNAPPPGRSPGNDVTAMVPPEAANPRNNKKGVFAPPNPKGSPVAPMGSLNPMMAPPQMEEQGPSVHEQMHAAQGQIPVMQRCVDKNGKSIFLADVEITDLSTAQPIFKTRTNGTGKWMASLGIGAYRVTISKRASMNKEKLEAVQDIQVDGTQSPLELPMMIIK